MKNNFSRREFIQIAAAASAAAVMGCKVGEIRGSDKKQMPVAVIGAGLGGLSAAAHLAMNGFPVTVIEQHERPGGYATSFQRNEFDFEISLHATASAKGGPMKEVFDATGISNKVEFAELPDMGRIITPNSDIILPNKDPGRAIDIICDAFPKHEKGVRGFMVEMFGIFDELMKPFDRDSTFETMLFPLSHRKVWGTRKKTLGEILDAHTGDSEVRAALAYLWPYFGLPPSRLSSFLYIVAASAYLKFGGYYTKMRSQDLSNALMKSIEERGGRVMLSNEVEEILMKDGAAAGVKLKGGEIVEAKAVISNASIPATLGMISAPKPAEKYSSGAAKFVMKMSSMKPAISSFMVWLGLNREVHREVSGYETFISSCGDPEEDYLASMRCDAKKANMIVVLYNHAFKGYSRPGTSIVSILMMSGYEPWRKFEKDYFENRKSAYNEFKNGITEELIRRTEESLIPGLRSMVKVKEAATPLTNVAFTGNPGGAFYGFEQTPENTFTGIIGPKTPFKGLYLSSAWCNGGGYQPSLGAGGEAFRALMKDWGLA